MRPTVLFPGLGIACHQAWDKKGVGVKVHSSV